MASIFGAELFSLYTKDSNTRQWRVNYNDIGHGDSAPRHRYNKSRHLRSMQSSKVGAWRQTYKFCQKCARRFKVYGTITRSSATRNSSINKEVLCLHGSQLHVQGIQKLSPFTLIHVAALVLGLLVGFYLYSMIELGRQDWILKLAPEYWDLESLCRIYCNY